MSNKTVLTIYIDTTIKKRLAEIKVKTGIPMGRVIEQALEKELPLLEKNHGINTKLKF